MPRFTSADAASLEAEIPALQRYARFLTRNLDDADDIVQTCLERAIRRFELFQPGTNLRSWLFTILHNEFVSGVRRTSRRGASVPLEDWHGELRVNGRQEAALEMRDLTRAFRKLPGRDRQILYLIGVEGRSYESTARLLSLRTGTVKSRLFRAREKLRAGMGHAPGAADARAA
ncbi:MAG: sigma-70 family RNA polymerase sigma factor [Sphingomonadales bacterium]